MKNIYILINIFLTLIFLTSTTFAQEIPNIKDALNYLQTYKFGMNREPLEPILDAVKTTQNDPVKQEQLSKQLVAVLPKCTIDGKRFIARQLVVIATPSVVPGIEPLLKNNETIDIGCRILEQIPGKEATQSLIKVLKQESITEDDEVAIINSLGRRKDSLSVETLSQYLENPSQKLQNSVIIALGSIGGKEAGSILWNWAKSKSMLENSNVQSALLKIASRLAEELTEKDMALEIYSSLFSNDKVTPINRAYALRGLVQLKGKDAFEEVWQSVGSEDTVLSSSGIDLLKDKAFPDTLLSERCVSTLETAKPRLQFGLLEVIASRKITDVVPQVLNLIEKSDGELKLSAIQCLSRVGDTRAIEPLMNIALSGPRDVRETAKDALIKLDNPDGNKYLMDKMQKGNLDVRKLAVELLTERRAVEAKEIMKNTIIKNDKDIIDEALNYFAILGDEQDLPFLFDKLMADIENSSSYIPALSLIIDRTGDEGKKVKIIMDQWVKCNNDLQKKSLISLLGNIKSPEACAVLERFLTSEPALKTNIFQSMGQCVDVNTLEKIINEVEKENVDEVKNAGILSSLNILRTLNLTDKQKFDYYITLWKLTGENPTIQKNILGGFTKLSLVEVLDFIEGIKVNDTIKADWANVRFNVAKNISFSYPSRTMSILEEMLPNLKDNQAKEVENLLKGLKNKGEFLCSWSISGPYRMEDYSARRLFDEVSLPPETDLNSVKDWRILPLKVRDDGLIYADLAEYSGGEVECVAYVACKITVPEPVEGKILLGTNDGVKVWLNGKLVHSFAEGRTMIPEQDNVPVKLEKNNILLMAIYNQGAAWEFTAKLQGISPEKVEVVPYSP
ncbi:MAG TPA: HEAT repeat domain-containing protein [Candidatus Hydrogenedens sp.]|mgnify:FL=1|nr:HEAT repeat domain-containing protein [Candidatus Hydrogenedens sp.]